MMPISNMDRSGFLPTSKPIQKSELMFVYSAIQIDMQSQNQNVF